MTMVEGELRAALRAEAAKHRPDREAMLDRITRTAVRSRRGKEPSPRLRMTGAAVAVAAVLGGGGFAQWALAGGGDPAPVPTPVVTVDPSPSGRPTPEKAAPSGTPGASASRTPKNRQSSRPPTSESPAAGNSSAPADPAVQGPLWSDGSVVPGGDTQAGSVVTVKTTERVDALEVTIRLARTDGLVSRGGSQQVPGASVTSTVVEEADAIVFRFVLSSADHLEPGTYTFAARYTHAAGGRDANGDSYRATAAGVTVSGDFG
ncbi:hypothetical protein [Actinoplanes couchii]|uniref:Uncharacterized protein n=1 Tax=Actinoplanes couchii TaxID=403638 RepID=A0ABQ3XIY6_9ACTN|nr:hypothetical protein [Actinoplanes couchii]MDR6323990.1 hypothetical protein [Actinoplanes couchii]GID58459.1 hypothetical protein Aco03nite_068630 [Actinoplanes couchii]